MSVWHKKLRQLPNVSVPEMQQELKNKTYAIVMVNNYTRVNLLDLV